MSERDISPDIERDPYYGDGPPDPDDPRSLGAPRIRDVVIEELRDERDEWQLRAEKAERERDEISASLAKMDAKWKRAYYQLQEYQDRDGGPVDE